MSDEGGGLLYEQHIRDCTAFNIAAVTLEEDWIHIKAAPHLGVTRTLALNFKAARALAYKLLAIADDRDEHPDA